MVEQPEPEWDMVLAPFHKVRANKVLATALAVGVALLSGCASQAPASKGFETAALQPYRLDSGDRLRVTVFEQQGLSNTYTVDQAGYIAFPLVGQVAARGQTLPALESAIAAKLKQGYLRDPDVSIEIDRYRPVFVMGEVGRPGQYSYVPGMTAQNAIAIAGGFTSRGNERDVDVTRKINGQVVKGRTDVTAPVLAGDTIYVRERLF
jgi:polysaccharide export outer membrane protein